MLNKTFHGFIFSTLIMATVAPATAADHFSADPATTGPYAIPMPDRQLQTVEATKWIQATDTATVLEGPVFDSAGNLLFVDVLNGKIEKATPDKKLTTLLEDRAIMPCALAFGPDNRLYVAAAYKDGRGGTIFSVDAKGEDRRVLLAADQGYLPNDIVFDAAGGLYFTDSHPERGERTGGVYYMKSGSQVVQPLVEHLASGNGLALSPDGKVLWVVEFSAGVLRRLNLQDATHVEPYGDTVAYRFSSSGPDSMKSDSEGNLYIALHGQGRVIVLNRNGTGIGQITIAGREAGRNLRTSNVAIKAGTREVYVTTADDFDVHGGSAIFKSEGFAPSLPSAFAK